MPIEIRELVIKAFIDESATGKTGADGGGGHAKENREEIIADCIEQVMRLLRDASER